MDNFLYNLSEEKKNAFIVKYGEKILNDADAYLVYSRYVSLFEKNGLYFGTCPYHYDNLVSFCVNPKDKSFSCSSCGKKGSIIEFIQSVEFCSKFDAYLIIADMSRMNVNNMLSDLIGPEENYPRIELCVRSGNSFNKGIGSVEDLVLAAKTAGIKGLALCDDYSTNGYARFKRACRNNGITPIYGATINVEDKRVVIIAKNQRGISSINQIISMSSNTNEEGHFKNSINDVSSKQTNSLLGINPYKYDIITIGILDNYQDLAFLLNNFDYVGISDPRMASLIYSSKLNRRIIAISDSYYCTENDKVLFDSLTNCHNEVNHKLMNATELLKRFRFDWVFSNPMVLSSQIDFKSFDVQERMYLPYEVNGEEFISNVKKLALINHSDFSEEEKQRLNKECEAVVKAGWAPIYDLFAKITAFLKENKQHYALRGSGSNMLLSYVLGISTINPVDWNLPSETFAGYSLDKIPDFDLNVSPDFKDKVDKFVCDLLGPDNVIRAGYIETLTDEQCARKVSHYLENTAPEYAYGDISDVKVFKLHDTACRYNCHPGALIVKPNYLSFYDLTPIKSLGNGDQLKTSLVDFHYIHDNLLKLDILNNQDCEFASVIEKLTKTKYDDVPLDDPDVLSLGLNSDALKKKETIIADGFLNPFIGVCEFGTDFMHTVIQTSKPRTLEDYISVASLGHGTGVWHKNAELLLKQNYSLNDIICNRDDIFNVLTNVYGVDRDIAFIAMEDARKGKGVRKDIESALISKKVPPYIIMSMQKFLYLFPRAHAIQYTITGLKQAYYKIHYPEEFYRSYFMTKFSSEKAAELLAKTNEELLMMIFNKSEDDFNDIFSDSYRIKTAATLIIEARERKVSIDLSKK